MSNLLNKAHPCKHLYLEGKHIFFSDMENHPHPHHYPYSPTCVQKVLNHANCHPPPRHLSRKTMKNIQHPLLFNVFHVSFCTVKEIFSIF
jgi:hypothetical protein